MRKTQIYIIIMAILVAVPAKTQSISNLWISWPGYGTTLNSAWHESPQHLEKKQHKYLPIALTLSAHAASAAPIYNHMITSWGRSDGRFHIKHDWTGDNMGHNDEVSHLIVSYKLSQFLHSGYRYIGYSEKTARVLGVVETFFIVTAVEYPLDAYNPTQGLGISDLIFDYMGITLGYLKISGTRFQNWDIKTSVKSFGHFNHQIIGDQFEDYDNYIYWLTYRKSSAIFGLGYSTSHPQSIKPRKEFYLAIGTTIPDLLKPISGKLSRFFRWAEVYYFNLRWNFRTID